MTWVAWSAGWWTLGAVWAWLVRSQSRLASTSSILTTSAGALCLAEAALSALRGTSETWQAPWATAIGPLELRLDPLAGAFLLPIAAVGALTAMFAPPYLDRLGTPKTSRLAAFPILLALLALVTLAGNMMLLLAGWEAMTLVTWFLITGAPSRPGTRSASIRLLTAAHLGAAALLVLFHDLARTGAGWSIPAGPVGAAAAPLEAGLLVTLLLVGFGTLAVLAPLPAWLPDVQAVAPSHVSALLSGAQVTVGFYGLLRFLPVLAPASLGWGLGLIALGAAGAMTGFALALFQRDVMRVLAYSTIASAGNATLAIGAALVAAASGHAALSAFAWTAALLHLWNHAVTSPLLFLSAGAIAQAVRSRDLERWGGLIKTVPVFGGALLIGGAAATGLPGTHGFAGSWLVFTTLFRASMELPGSLRYATLLGLAATAASVGLALACFVRLGGIGLLGQPRSRESSGIRAPKSGTLAAPVVILAGMSFALVALLEPLLDLLAPAVNELAPGSSIAPVKQFALPLPWLATLVFGGIVVIALSRASAKWPRSIRWTVTWDGGYAHPTPAQQYTATSLSQPFARALAPGLRADVRWTPPRSLWPDSLVWESLPPEAVFATPGRSAPRGGSKRATSGGSRGRGISSYLGYAGVALVVLAAGLILWARTR